MTAIHGFQGVQQRSDGRSEPSHIGFSDKGGAVYLFVGTATTDGEIVSDIGADANFADGSLYISAVVGAGKLFQKRNGVWTSI